MHDAYAGAEKVTEAFLDAVELENACGFMAFAGEEFVGLDLLSGPVTFASLRRKLLESYALDALVRMGKPCGFTRREEGERVISQLRGLGWQDFPGVSLGTEARAEDSGLVARALVHEGKLVSLSSFARAEI